MPVPVGLSYFDDILFIRSATFIAQRDWLGPFDNVTLAKGPAYPVFIAGMHYLGIPLKVGEQLTVLAAAAALAGCVRLAARSLLLATGVYVLLALDPINFNAQSAELVRDGWYGSLTLLFVALVFLAVFATLYRFAVPWRVLSSLTAGFVGGTLWLCREEGPTILPPIAVVAIGLPALVLTQRWLAVPRAARHLRLARPVMLRLGLVLGLAATTFALPIIAVDLVNDRYYGVALANDTAAGTMPRAFADWTRVQAGTPVFQAPITEAQRFAVYAVSPAALELADTLENPDFSWRQFSCADGATPGCEYLGAFMAWAIRDAARNAGHFTSESEAQAYFGRLSDEIEAACDNGRLQCAPRLPAALQSLQRASAQNLIDAFGSVFTTAVLSRDFYEPIEPASSAVVTPDLRAQTAAVVGGIPIDQAGADQKLAAFQARSWPYTALGAVYTILVPLLSILALGGLVLGCWRRQSPRSTLLVLTVALGVGFGVRTTLLALISATDFDADIVRYQLPSHMFLISFGLVGTAFLLAAVRPRPDTRQAETGAMPAAAG